MRSAQDHARRTPRLQRFLPPRCAETPAITGLQSRKAEFRDRSREIIAAGLRILKKSRGHDGAHGVAADVLAAGVAAAVPKKARHRAQGADFESIAQHVVGLVPPAAAALASIISKHRNSLNRRSLPHFKNVYSVRADLTTLFGRIPRLSPRSILLVGDTDSKKTERVYRHMNHVNLTSPRPPTSKSPARDRVRGA